MTVFMTFMLKREIVNLIILMRDLLQKVGTNLDFVIF